MNESAASLCLLGGPFLVRNGKRLDIPNGSKRLLVFVALKGGRVSRRRAAGTLWPSGSDERAAGNLRSALWRLRVAGIEVLQADRCTLYLDPEISMDISQLSLWAKKVIDGAPDAFNFETLDLNLEAMDLLPGWYDEWVLIEREQLRQLLLHAIELLVPRLISDGSFADAVRVAMTAVGAEPLRESAQRALIEAHLAEGNFVEADRAYSAYNKMLAAELGVSPSAALVKIVSRRRAYNSCYNRDSHSIRQRGSKSFKEITA